MKLASHSLHLCRTRTYNRTNIGPQSQTCDGPGDRVRVDKPTGTRRFVYDAWGRVISAVEQLIG